MQVNQERPALRILIVLPDGDLMKPEWILIANATRACLLQLDQRVAHGSAH